MERPSVGTLTEQEWNGWTAWQPEVDHEAVWREDRSDPIPEEEADDEIRYGSAVLGIP